MKINVGKLLWLRLATDENKFIRTLARVRKDIQDAIGYKEIEEMILTQNIPVSVIEQTQKEYAQWLANDLKEYYKKYGEAGFAIIAEQFQRKVKYDKVLVYVDKWILSRGSDLVTKINEDQKIALRTILHKFVVEEPKSPEELSYYIRSVVGLTKPQTEALTKMYDALVEQGMPNNVIIRTVTRSAKEMHMYRARMIARTELSYAYNRGTLAEMTDIGNEYQLEIRKIWLTAPDEFVCERCAALNGKEIGLYDEFPSGDIKKTEPAITPPLHPNCRCSLIYEVR